MSNDKKKGDIEVMDAETTDIDTTTLEAITAGEVSSQVATARRYPRSITTFRKRATDMAVMDEQTALSCLYALPRGNKTIEGPSARLAEILQICYGNVRTGGRVVSIDREHVTVQAIGWDLESNAAVSADVKRRITDKFGKRYNEDMIGVTSNAAIAIGIRNVTLKIIPQALWRPVYDAAKKVIVGDATTLGKRRTEMLDYFMKMGVRNEAVFAVLEVKGEADITLDHLVTMRATAEAIKAGELTIDGVFNPEDAGGAKPSDPLELYLEHVQDAELTKEIRALFGKLALNKGQMAARLKQHEGHPKALIVELQKLVDTKGADPATPAASSQPTSSTAAGASVPGSTASSKPEKKADEEF